jgi:hypothetical protein
MRAMADRLLAIYLQDHLAGATAGTELARRARGSNEETPLGEFLDVLAEEVEADRDALREIMDELGVRADPVKNALGWGAEKLGRLKPNGQFTGYSPLSRIVELEGLTVGVRGKQSLWENLRATFGEEVAGRNLDGLISRAGCQIEELTEHRREAARLAFEDEVTRVG